MADASAKAAIIQPSPLFTDPRSLKALANGSFYVGAIDTDPTQPSNQIPVYNRNEDGSLVQVSQPISIGVGGYPVLNGVPFSPIVASNYSIAVFDSIDVQRFYFSFVEVYQPLDSTLTELSGMSPTDITAYLGLQSGSMPIGMPFYWPSATMPNLVIPEWSGMTFLKFNGATFSSITYPKLALVFPSLTLPDTRGEFIRNWDDGRGVDTGRALLSAQSSGVPNINTWFDSRAAVNGARGAIVDANTNVFTITDRNPTSGTGGQLGPTTNNSNWDRVTMSLGKNQPVYVDGLTEARPRSIAFNFIVRAA